MQAENPVGSGHKQSTGTVSPLNENSLLPIRMADVFNKMII